MSTYSDDELLMLSGIPTLRFCRRQWAMIHIGATMAGKSAHFWGYENYMSVRTTLFLLEARGGRWLICSSLPIVSYRLDYMG